MSLSTLRDLEGIAFDVDDTLTRDGIFELEALQALYQAKSAGLSLAAVTGRPLGWSDALAQLLPVDLSVGENGAGWAFHRGSVLVHGYLHTEEERREQGARLAELQLAVAGDFPDVSLAADHAARRCDLAYSIGEETPLSRPRIDALTARIASLGLRPVESSIHLHAMAGDWDKAQGLVRAWHHATKTPLNRDRWLFVGDSPNDAAAFSFFPNAVGVANVARYADRLPTRPEYITEASHGRGFAEVITKVLGARS